MAHGIYKHTDTIGQYRACFPTFLFLPSIEVGQSVTCFWIRIHLFSPLTNYSLNYLHSTLLNTARTVLLNTARTVLLEINISEKGLYISVYIFRIISGSVIHF